MSTVKRKAPRGLHNMSLIDNGIRTQQWQQQCLQDLASGRHAEGCECTTYVHGRWTLPNACSEIVRCALEMRSYETEVGDA